jgi:hypothetical protein
MYTRPGHHRIAAGQARTRRSGTCPAPEERSRRAGAAAAGERARTSAATGGSVVPLRGRDVVRVSSRASVQFTEPFLFRVLRIHDWSTSVGWCWLDVVLLRCHGQMLEVAA